MKPHFFSSDYIIVKVHSLDRDVSGNSVVLTKNTLITNAGNSFKLFIILLKKYFFFPAHLFHVSICKRKTQRCTAVSLAILAPIIINYPFTWRKSRFYFPRKNMRFFQYIQAKISLLLGPVNWSGKWLLQCLARRINQWL